MSTTLTRQTHQADQAHHEQSVHPEQRIVRTTSLLDRAALHLGVALITWSRRPGLAAQERRANRLERALLSSRRDAYIQRNRERAQLDYTTQLRLR